MGQEYAYPKFQEIIISIRGLFHQGVGIGINPRDLAHGLLIIWFDKNALSNLIS